MVSGMTEMAKPLLERACATLKAAGALEVYAFGSVIRESFRAGSDLDLPVRGLPPECFYRATALATDAVGRGVDLVDLDAPTPFTRYLGESGELIRVG